MHADGVDSVETDSPPGVPGVPVRAATNGLAVTSLRIGLGLTVVAAGSDCLFALYDDRTIALES
jgi:hypothetical protein